MPDQLEIPSSFLRLKLAEVLNDTAVYGQIIYITHYGRRVAAIVPVPQAEKMSAAEAQAE